MFQKPDGTTAPGTLQVKNLKAVHSLYKNGPSTIYHYYDVVRLMPKSVGLHDDNTKLSHEELWSAKTHNDARHVEMKGNSYQSELRFHKCVFYDKTIIDTSNYDVTIDFIRATILHHTPRHPIFLEHRDKIIRLTKSALPKPEGYPFSRPGAELIQAILKAQR
jgi:hypothetical protein